MVNPGDGTALARCPGRPQPGREREAGRWSRAGICWFCSQLYLQGLDTVGAQYLLVERLLKMSDGGMMGDVISPSIRGR